MFNFMQYTGIIAQVVQLALQATGAAAKASNTLADLNKDGAQPSQVHLQETHDTVLAIKDTVDNLLRTIKGQQLKAGS